MEDEENRSIEGSVARMLAKTPTGALAPFALAFKDWLRDLQQPHDEATAQIVDGLNLLLKGALEAGAAASAGARGAGGGAFDVARAFCNAPEVSALFELWADPKTTMMRIGQLVRLPGQPFQPTIENVNPAAVHASILAAARALLRRPGAAKRRVKWAPFIDVVLRASLDRYVVNLWMHARESFRRRLVAHFEEKILLLCFCNGDAAARDAARAVAPNKHIRQLAKKIVVLLFDGRFAVPRDLIDQATTPAGVAALAAHAAALATAVADGARPKRLELAPEQAEHVSRTVKNFVLRACAILGPVAPPDEETGLCRPLSASVMELHPARVTVLNHFHDRTLAGAKRATQVRPLLPEVKNVRAVEISPTALDGFRHFLGTSPSYAAARAAYDEAALQGGNMAVLRALLHPSKRGPTRSRGSRGAKVAARWSRWDGG